MSRDAPSLEELFGVHVYDSEPDIDEEFCWTCGGDGVLMTCCDDICHGLGECIHGDGEEVCPDCGGAY